MRSKFIFFLLASLFAGPLLVGCGGRPTPQSRTGDNSTEYVTAGEQVQTLLGPSIVNVFVENSGSMDGYVKGVTEFEQAVYSYISDIKLCDDVCLEMNLYYINSKKLKQPDNVADFIEKLEPASFRLKGGNRQTTDLSNVIGDVVSEQKPEEINILVSDCVFSPGRGKNANEYLVNQQIGIKGHIANKLKENPNFAVIVYQLNSNFDGTYYNCFDQGTKINNQRPFYILIFGDKDRLHMLTDKVSVSKIKGSGVKHSYYISNSTVKPDYGILVMPKIGSFQPDPRNPKTGIVKAKVDKRNPTKPFSVSVGANFSSLLLEDEYICNVDNYTISNKSYELSIGKSKNPAYTHTLTLSLTSPIISKGKIDITLRKLNSSWAEEMTDEDGKDIMVPGAMEKTFGLKYLIDGIYDAYSNDKQYAYLGIIIQ